MGAGVLCCDVLCAAVSGNPVDGVGGVRCQRPMVDDALGVWGISGGGDSGGDIGKSGTAAVGRLWLAGQAGFREAVLGGRGVGIREHNSVAGIDVWLAS